MDCNNQLWSATIDRQLKMQISLRCFCGDLKLMHVYQSVHEHLNAFCNLMTCNLFSGCYWCFSTSIACDCFPVCHTPTACGHKAKAKYFPIVASFDSHLKLSKDQQYGPTTSKCWTWLKLNHSEKRQGNMQNMASTCIHERVVLLVQGGGRINSTR